MNDQTSVRNYTIEGEIFISVTDLQLWLLKLQMLEELDAAKKRIIYMVEALQKFIDTPK